MKMFFTTLITLIIFCSASQAQAFSEFVFGSKHDYFTLEKAGSSYTLKGERVKLGPFKEFVSLFSQEFVEECPGLPEKPDVTVKAKRGGKYISRHFYVEEKVVSDKKMCATITGDGIYFIPMHRRWFIGADKFTIPIKDEFTLKLREDLSIKFTKKDGEWRSHHKEFFVDWDFVDPFIESFKGYSIDARLHPAAAKGQTNFEMIVKGNRYKFARVGTNLWAVERPGRGYLEASNRWSFWKGMDNEVLRSRHTTNLALVRDQSLDVKSRLNAMSDIGASWNRTIQHVYQDIVTNPDEPLNLRRQAANHLKQHPSLENMGALVKALDYTDDGEFQNFITKTLRIRNPKGPVIQPDDSELKRSEAIQAWRSWWKNATD